MEWLDKEVGDVCSRGWSDPGSVGSGGADCCMLQAESGVVAALAVWRHKENSLTKPVSYNKPYKANLTKSVSVSKPNTTNLTDCYSEPYKANRPKSVSLSEPHKANL